MSISYWDIKDVNRNWGQSYLLQSKLNYKFTPLFLQSGAKSFENCTIEIPEESNEDAETDSDGMEDIHWKIKFLDEIESC